MPPNSADRIDLYAAGIWWAKIGEYLSYLKITFWAVTIIGYTFIGLALFLSIRQLSNIALSARIDTLVMTLNFAIIAAILWFAVLRALGTYYLILYFRPINTYIYQKSFEPGLKSS